MTIMADEHARYGTAIGLFKGKEVYLSRRIEVPLFPKKWQFANGRLKGGEQSLDAAIRVVEEQTGIKIDKSRLNYVTGIPYTATNEYYYAYLVHLEDSEIPANTDKKYRSDWRLFDLESAIVLDVVPGLRRILVKTRRALLKVEEESDQNHNESTDTYI
jgi:8-oxo-dGTP pyrophosphatase MutT (NUDIX family)